MKHAAFLALLLLAAFGLAGCNGSRPIAPPRVAATEFFQEIGESRFQNAYNNATFAFQAQTSFKNFRATARELGLSAGTVICHWTKEETQNSEVKLTGEVMAANETGVPVIVTLIQERGAWRVFSLRNPNPGGKKEADPFSLLGKGAAFNCSVNREIPPLPMLQKLTLDSLLLFNDALQRQHFGDFYSQVSTTWQNQLTVGQLKRAFQPFIDAKVNLSDLQRLEPAFDKPPEINTSGVLVLKGHYETKPYRTFFVLQYVYEFPFWKLIGLEVEIHN